MSCDIGCLTVLFHTTAECGGSIIQPCRWKLGSQTSFPSVCDQMASDQSFHHRKQRTLQLPNFSNLPLYFFLYLLLKTPISSSSFFSKLIFSPFISLHLAPSLSRVMLLKGFLLFCNEGSWCCQHRLAASPALLFYSGLAKKSLISKSNETRDRYC